MKQSDDFGHEPTRHYDTVIEAWAHLLQEDMHYGYFRTGEESLITATDFLTDEMAALARLKSGDKVLDIGCGTGKAACRLAQESNCFVTGISPSQVCVDNAAARASDLGLEANVKFCLGDGMRPDFPASSFDCAWVMESSHLMEDKAALISACARLLKPGGRLVLCDIMLDHKLELGDVIAHRDQFLLLKEVFGRARMETLEFYQRQCEINQLTLSSSRNISTATLPTFSRWQQNALLNKEKVINILDETAWQKFFDSCEVLEKFWHQEILGYGILAACKAG
jgi:27-O-demethylrifamycin SV methyltransferase